MKVRLAVALRMFAGASYVDVALLFGIAKESVFHIMWEVVDAINNTPEVGAFFFPQTVEECTRQAREWEVGARVCLYIANPPGVLFLWRKKRKVSSALPLGTRAQRGVYWGVCSPKMMCLTEWAHSSGRLCVEPETIPLICLHRCSPVQNANDSSRTAAAAANTNIPALHLQAI